MEKKIWIASVVIVAIVVISAGVYFSPSEKPTKNVQNPEGTKKALDALNAEKPTIRANVNKDCSGTPWFVGMQKGFFEQAGINFVDKGHLEPSQHPVALISGQVDVNDGDPQSIINLLKAGAKIKGVVQSGAEPPEGHLQHEHMHWLVSENSSLQTPKDILNAGRKVKIAFTALGICADLEANEWLRQNGIPKDKVEYVVIPDPQQEQALRQGLIDIAVLHPPFYTAAEEHGGVRILVSSRKIFGDAGGISLLYFTEDFIKKNPDTIRKFIKGYKNAERWSNDNPGESAILTGKEIGLDKASTHYYSYTGVVNESVIQVWIDAMVKDGLIKPGEFKPSDLYTTEFKDAWS